MSASKPSPPSPSKGGPSTASASTSNYRTTTVEDDDDDDLDDLDDVLTSFNAPKSTLGKRSQPEPAAAPTIAKPAAAGPSTGPDAAAPAAAAPTGGANDEDFEASLIEGMESLLRSLANEHPPGPMPDASKRSPGPAGPSAASPGMSSEEEEKAFQRAIEMMLSGEGLEALGLDDKAKPSASGASPKPRGVSGAGAAAGAAGAGAAGTSFEETIRQTMASINAGGASANAGAGAGDQGDLAALLKQLSEDPSMMDGLGDDDDELGGLLDGMMAQLMSKEVLEEPMTELAAKYPEYLANPPAGVSATDLDKYRQQHAIVKQILAAFKRPGYSDDTDGKDVARLVGEMQDLGGPPNEIMGELPEGFDLGALGGGEEGCVVM